jgi:serine protease Do
MNNRNFWTVLGLAALSIALLALPGSSARKQVPGNTSQKQSKIIINQEQEVPRVDADSADLIEVEGLPEDDDVQVLMSTRGSWLGVGVAEVTPEKVKELRLPAERGALLGKILPDSPAAKAGLKENDVVTEINGQRVEGSEQFRRMIREIPAGRSTQLSVWRDGRLQNVAVTLGKPELGHARAMVAPAPGTFAFHMPDLPDMSALDGLRNFSFSSPGHARLGIDAEDLDGDLGNYFGAPDGEGVLVRNVFESSPAAKAGLKAGDVITSLDGERIRNASELRQKLVAKKDAKSVKLGLLRNRSELSLTVELPSPEQQERHHASERTNI